jgi:hypothetical protein
MAVNLFDKDAIISRKVQETADVFYGHLADAAKTPDNWLSFLNCAGRMYKYSFVDQMLIHAQRPDATACAEMGLWNERMGRWVKRGSKGITLIDQTNPKRPFLKYIFDIQDTQQSSNSGKAPYIWQMREEHAPYMRKFLSAAYGIDASDINAQISAIAKKLTIEYTTNQAANFEEYNDIIANSVAYTVMSRCGLEIGTREEVKEKFSGVSQFDTDEEVSEFGLAAAKLSGQILGNIERPIRRYDIWKEQRKDERSVSNNGTETGADVGRRSEDAIGQVRADETQASGGERRTPVQPTEGTGAIGQPSSGDKRDGARNSGGLHGRDAEEESDTRRPEEQQPDGMGGTHGESESAGRGNRDQGTDFYAADRGLERTGISDMDSVGRAGEPGVGRTAVLNAAIQEEKLPATEEAEHDAASSNFVPFAPKAENPIQSTERSLKS